MSRSDRFIAAMSDLDQAERVHARLLREIVTCERRIACAKAALEAVRLP